MTNYSEKQREKEENSHFERRSIYQGKVFSVYSDIFPDEKPLKQWDIVDHTEAVGVVPITRSGKIILVKQWRRAAGHILYEIPAGCIDPNEKPLECAQRELQEEIGYKAHTFISIGGYFSSPGFCNEYLHLFIAKNLEKSKLPHDEHEAIDIEEFNLEELLTMIDSHLIQDLKTVAAVLYYMRWKAREQL